MEFSGCSEKERETSLYIRVWRCGHPRGAAGAAAQAALWNSLLVHFREQGALVEGPLSNLKQSLVALSRPIKASPPP